ncbi:HlyD family secretion protein [Neiella marina]|uniref:HlyD family secretion protein n=1 Tax=Neiella holothuriorum TaxID=2870530 RepID=A0ABS7EKC7_9GAMM|nr:HlyD family secretion protein [Neiella holothuriorum]MBW8192750.1 HlyD family secretion protein [Neiella holothuriorum]
MTDTTEQKQPEPAPAKSDVLQKISKVLLALCVVFFILYLIMDRFAPDTELARVKVYITPVTPEVSGHIKQIHVQQSQRLQEGDIMFTIDPTDYLVAVEQAQENLRLAGSKVGAQMTDVEVAQSRLADAKTQLETMVKQTNRIFSMAGKGIVSQADADNAQGKLDAAEARVITAEADLQKAKQALGATGADNANIKAALLQLEDAQLDLARTRIHAKTVGGIANLQVEKGYYAQAGQPIASYINAEQVWVEAYFRENNLEHINIGDAVAMVLDNAPGRVFDGKVSNISWAVDFGDNVDPSKLAKSQQAKGWMRDPQRFPVTITFDDKDELKGLMRHGGQVDVIIYASDSWILNTLGSIWIHIVALLSYAR